MTAPPPAPSSSKPAPCAEEVLADTLTAEEFLAQQSALEAEAAALLPFSIDACSFAKGPLTQSIYSCIDCDAGVCYACFVQCHTSHEVVELFERRDFTCDCGTLRCKAKCLLQSKSIGETNELNKYDDAFKGIFCFCKLKYDYDAESAMPNSVMFQCSFCEDWFHDRCIKNCPGTETEEGEPLDFEFVCKDCVAQYGWLLAYEGSVGLDAFVFVGEEDEHEADEEENGGEGAAHSGAVRADTNVAMAATPARRKRKAFATPGTCDNNKRRVTTLSSEADIPDSPVARLETQAMEPLVYDSFFPPPETRTKATPTSAQNLFCLPGWRDTLCRCPTCHTLYTTHALTHLLAPRNPTPRTPGGSAHPQQRPDTDAGKSLHEGGLEALRKIPRVQAIEGVLAYERLAAFAKEYLGRFAREGRVVSEADVREMFEELKRQGGAGGAGGRG
ncbi:hypothetical protein BC830DRAFT_1174064 [Chytriomyces sp. MP71]|nr:hypothetical protein BC830DRAFT_1174064 [Chytriomyces sp. MP71]